MATNGWLSARAARQLQFITYFLLHAYFVADVICVVRNLKQVHIVYRHGDRTPLKTFKGNDSDADWPNGLGTLTTRGIEEQYLLGTFLRIRYSEFLHRDRFLQEVYIRSTDHDRTLQSAAANAAGMFPPTNSTWRSGDNRTLGKLWRPMPIHSVPVTEEFLLKPTADCPKLTRLNEELYELPYTSALEFKHRDLDRLLIQHAEEAGRNFWERVTNVADACRYLRSHNSSLPVWVDNTVYEKLVTLSNVIFHLWAGGYGDIQRARLVGGSLLHTILDRMHHVTGLKMFIYSGHDSTVSGLLAALYMLNASQSFGIPPYNAVIFLELFQNDTVRVSYKSGSADLGSTDPVVLIHPGCSDFCPIEHLTTIVKVRTVADWRHECDDRNPLIRIVSDHVPPSSAWLVPMFFGLVVLVFIAVKYWKNRKTQGTAQPHATSDPVVSYRTLEDQSI